MHVIWIHKNVRIIVHTDTYHLWTSEHYWCYCKITVHSFFSISLRCSANLSFTAYAICLNDYLVYLTNLVHGANYLLLFVTNQYLFKSFSLIVDLFLVIMTFKIWGNFLELSVICVNEKKSINVLIRKIIL